MNRISTAIHEVYQKILPLAEQCRVQLDLDFNNYDPSLIDPTEVATEIETQLSALLDRTQSSTISISVDKDHAKIHDSGTTLSRPVCAALSSERVHTKSRVGFGTTITIDLHK